MADPIIVAFVLTRSGYCAHKSFKFGFAQGVSLFDVVFYPGVTNDDILNSDLYLALQVDLLWDGISCVGMATTQEMAVRHPL